MQELMDYNPGWDKAVEEKLRKQYLNELNFVVNFTLDKIFKMRNHLILYRRCIYWINKGYEGMLEMLIDDGRIFLCIN